MFFIFFPPCTKSAKVDLIKWNKVKANWKTIRNWVKKRIIEGADMVEMGEKCEKNSRIRKPNNLITDNSVKKKIKIVEKPAHTPLEINRSTFVRLSTSFENDLCYLFNHFVQINTNQNVHNLIRSYENPQGTEWLFCYKNQQSLIRKDGHFRVIDYEDDVPDNLETHKSVGRIANTSRCSEDNISIKSCAAGRKNGEVELMRAGSKKFSTTNFNSNFKSLDSSRLPEYINKKIEGFKNEYKVGVVESTEEGKKLVSTLICGEKKDNKTAVDVNSPKQVNNDERKLERIQVKTMLDLLEMFYKNHELFYKNTFRVFFFQINDTIQGKQGIDKILKLVDIITDRYLGLSIYITTLGSWKDGFINQR